MLMKRGYTEYIRQAKTEKEFESMNEGNMITIKGYGQMTKGEWIEYVAEDSKGNRAAIAANFNAELALNNLSVSGSYYLTDKEFAAQVVRYFKAIAAPKAYAHTADPMAFVKAIRR